MIGLGEAIALGNIGHVDKSNRMAGLNQAIQGINLRKARRESAQAKQDAKLSEEEQKAADALDIKGLHPKLQAETQEYVSKKLAEAAQLKAQDPHGTYSKRRSLINDAANHIAEQQSKSKIYSAFDTVPYNELGTEGKRFADVYRNTTDARNLPEEVSPITGEGIRNGIPVVNRKKYADLNEEAAKHFNHVEQVYDPDGSRKINNHDELNRYVYSPETVKTVAETMWQDPEVRDSWINQNVDYIKGKYLKEQAGASGVAAPGELYKDNKLVQADLKEKFLNDFVAPYASIRAKQEMRGIPQPKSNNGGIGLNLSGLQNQGNTPKSVTVKVPFKFQGQTGSTDYNIPTGTQFSLKVTKVQNLKGDNTINPNGNKKMKGQTVTEGEVGNAIAMPVATKEIRTKGGVIEAGAFVDPNKVSKQDYEWRPMFSGVTQIKDKNGKTVSSSFFTPVEDLSASILISQSKDDQEATAQQIQAAIDEAKQKNSEKRTSKKDWNRFKRK